MTRKPVSTAIFIGKGLSKDTPDTFMDWGFVTIDADRNFVDTDSLPPDADLSGYRMGGVALRVGKENALPTWGDSTNNLIKAVASENFAHPRMQEQIDGWLNEGVEGDALHAKIKEAKGLITLKDVGLEELPAPGETTTTGG